jgi:4a-hydroxytetrahydrobiopterin dehydratase
MFGFLLLPRGGAEALRGGGVLCYNLPMNLTKKKCIPCEDKTMKPFTTKQAKEYMKHVPKWELAKNAKKISRTWLFKDFVKALAFVTKVAKVAEREGHHPNISIDYNKVTLDLWTHSIGGLSENDFIVAAKINALK